MIIHDQIDHPRYDTVQHAACVLNQGGCIHVDCSKYQCVIRVWPQRPQKEDALVVTGMQQIKAIYDPSRSEYCWFHRHREESIKIMIQPSHRWSKQHHWNQNKSLIIIQIPHGFCAILAEKQPLALSLYEEKTIHPLTVIDEGYSMMNYIKVIQQ